MKRIRKLTTAFLVIALLVTSLVSVPALAAEADPVDRIAGDSRYLTAIAVSKRAYPTKGELSDGTVIIASGENFPDALAGSVLASEEGAPILLTRKDSIDEKTLAEIARLGAKKVTILGGDKAVGAPVLDTLTRKGLAVKTIEGANRYETAAKIAKALGTTHTKVFLATGENYADALAIGPYAAEKGIPILLTTSNALHADTAKALKSLGVTDVVILGGEKAVSKAVERSLEELGIRKSKIERIEGANRELTALAIAKEYQQELSSEKLIAVTGDNFADAVVGAYFGATFAQDDNGPLPIVLVRGSVKDEVDQYIRYAFSTAKPPVASAFKKLYIIGGPLAVSESAEAVLEDALLKLPPKVVAVNDEFYVKLAPTAGASFAYHYGFAATTTKKAVSLDGKALKAGLDAITWTESADTSVTVSFAKTLLDGLAVGKHLVEVSLDGHAMPAQEIVVKALPTTATLAVTGVDPDEVEIGDAEDVNLTLMGYTPNPTPGLPGAFDDTLVGEVSVSVNNIPLSTTDFDVDKLVVTLVKNYIATLTVPGEYTVTIKHNDGRKATAKFEVKAAPVGAIYASFTAGDDKAVVLPKTVNELASTDVVFYINGVSTLDDKKVAVSFASSKLDKDREFTVDATSKKVTLKKEYLEDKEVGTYSIAVTYDGIALNALTLKVTPGAIDTDESEIDIAAVIEVQEIVPVTITLADSYGNPVMADEVVDVTLTTTGGVAAISENDDMSDADTSVLHVRLDEEGMAVVYFQALTAGKFMITVSTVETVPQTITTGDFEVN